MRTGHKSNFIFISVITTVTFAWLLLSLYFFWLNAAQREDYILSQDTLILQSQNIVLETYEKFSNYIFETMIDVPEITALMAETSDASPEALKQVRDSIYRKLESIYIISEKYDIGTLHFHLPDGTSFLRMNRPDIYGDSLSDVRTSVKIANSELRYVKGFEEGRTFNGYRFVYPLFHEDNHVGSVEISVSIASVMKAFNKNFPSRDINFILRKDLINSIKFPEDQKKYIASDINENYMVDQEVINAIENNITYSHLYIDQSFIDALKYKLKPHLDQMKSFSFSLPYNQKAYLIQYIALQNIEGNMVGYLYSIGEDPHFLAMRNALSTQLIASFVSYFIIISVLAIFGVSRKKINALALKDTLTNIYNRYSFYELAQREIARSDRSESCTSFAMLDIDLFKRVNDTYGHGVGDDILVEITKVVSLSIRDSDIFGRYGGEEFILMMPESDLAEAIGVAERIRTNVENHTFTGVGHLTISIGLSERLSGESIDASINRADLALYEAKQSGRNRVCG